MHENFVALNDDITFPRLFFLHVGLILASFIVGRNMIIFQQRIGSGSMSGIGVVVVVMTTANLLWCLCAGLKDGSNEL